MGYLISGIYSPRKIHSVFTVITSQLILRNTAQFMLECIQLMLKITSCQQWCAEMRLNKLAYSYRNIAFGRLKQPHLWIWKKGKKWKRRRNGTFEAA